MHWVHLGKDILDHESNGTETGRNGSLPHNKDEACDLLPAISITRVTEKHARRTTDVPHVIVPYGYVSRT
jgi:hypothetical protein